VASQNLQQNEVAIVEVGLRDGLQNENVSLPLQVRLALARALSDAGIRRIEIGSFVSPKWVPTMEMSEELTRQVLAQQSKNEINVTTEFSALVPNEKGMETAIQSGIKEVSLFAACSESFSYKNINCSMEESFKRFKTVAQMAQSHQIKIRGYLSVCFSCPFEGLVDYNVVLENVQKFLDLGCFEVSIGDTIGAATAGEVEQLFSILLKKCSPKNLAGHYHDTRGQALANILKSYQMGIRVFDSSIGGLGGCPYAPSATGNVATEDVIYLFNGLKAQTGVDLQKLVAASNSLSLSMGRPLASKVANANGSVKPKGSYCPA
jgi:hydroxymethylglutaryl-CoA lyase